MYLQMCWQALSNKADELSRPSADSALAAAAGGVGDVSGESLAKTIAAAMRSGTFEFGAKAWEPEAQTQPPFFWGLILPDYLFLD